MAIRTQVVLRPSFIFFFTNVGNKVHVKTVSTSLIRSHLSVTTGKSLLIIVWSICLCQSVSSAHFR